MAKRGRKKQSDAGLAREQSLLPLKSDIVFKMVFADNRNVDVLRCFLAAALDIPQEQFEEVAVIDTHLELEYPDDKLGILDVRVLTRSGKRIDIEIQLYPYPFMPERITFYTCKNLTSQIASGESYEAIRKTITIVIFDYSFLDSPSYRHQFNLYDARNKVLLTDVIEIYTLELSKLPAAEDEENLLLYWLQLFKAQRLEEYEMLAAKNPAIKKTVDILKRLSADDKARLAYEAREKAIRDDIAKMSGAYSKGILEGRQEEKREMAKKLLARGVAPDVIADTSGLSPSDIQSLME